MTVSKSLSHMSNMAEKSQVTIYKSLSHMSNITETHLHFFCNTKQIIAQKTTTNKQKASTQTTTTKRPTGDREITGCGCHLRTLTHHDPMMYITSVRLSCHCSFIFLCVLLRTHGFSHRLVGLVVKASASRAEGPGFESRLRRDFFGVESYQ